jgi:ABC-type polysaccharide/polyol phosphate export permease
MIASVKRLRPESGPSKQKVVAYEPWKHGVWPRMQEIWAHRHMIKYVSIQYTMKRYRRTYLGWIWIFLRPGLQIITSTFFFGGVIGVKYGDRPAAVYLSVAGAAWILFERSFHWGMRSVRMSMSLSKGLHLPRSLTSFSAAAPAIVDCVVHSLLSAGIIIYYMIHLHNNYFAPPPQWLLGFAGAALLLLFGIASGLFLGPLMIVTKEVRYLQMYVLTFWQMITPLYFAEPHHFQKLVELNPLTAPVQLVLYGFLAASMPVATSMMSCFVCLGVLMCSGLLFSSRMERAAVARL